MGFADYLPVILRRKWIVIITFAATLVVAILGYLFIPKIHTAETIIRVIPYSGSEPPYAQIVYAERIMNTYVEIAESSPILDEMRRRVGLGDEQPRAVQVGIIPDSELIRISVDDSNPDIAQNVANTMAKILIEQRSIQNVRISIVQPGELVTSPSLLKNLVYLFVVVVLGTVGGVGLALLLDNLDSTLHTTKEIEEYANLPVLTKIPGMKKTYDAWKDTPPWLDAIFRLRKKVLAVINMEEQKTILFISAIPGEGKSTLTASLAQSFSQSGVSTLVVDANYHTPQMHSLLDVPNEAGFLEALESNRLMSDAILDTKQANLQILPSGNPPSDAVNLISSENLVKLIDKLKAKADLVLLDSPAFLVAAETAVFAQVVDAVFIVVGSGICDEDALKEMVDQLEKNNVHPSGIIVNHSKELPTFKYWKLYYPNRRRVASSEKA